jgi:hypothetical protein
MQFTVVELDGSDHESLQELTTWMKRIRDSKALHGPTAGPTALVLDGFESYTPEARTIIARLLAKEDRAHCPVIITCTEFKNPMMRSLHGTADVRLFKPRAHTIQSWFRNIEVHGKRPLHAWFTQELLATGDLRRVRNALEWRARTDSQLKTGPTQPRNIFEASRALMQHAADPSEWAEQATWRDADLLREHVPQHLNSIEDADTFFAGLSCAAACQPDRFECSHAHAPFPLTTVALTTHITCHARDVGALAPRAPPRSVEGHTGSSRSRTLTRMERLDVPAPLRDRS